MEHNKVYTVVQTAEKEGWSHIAFIRNSRIGELQKKNGRSSLRTSHILEIPRIMLDHSGNDTR